MKPFVILLIAFLSHVAEAQVDEAVMRIVLNSYNEQASLLCNRNSKANWAVQTDVLNETLKEEQASDCIKILRCCANT